MKATELLREQSSVENQDREKSISTNNNVVEQVKDTPFVLVKQNGEWLIVMGDQQMSSEKFVTKDGAIKYINKKPWELIMNASAYYREIYNQYKNEFKQEDLF